MQIFKISSSVAIEIQSSDPIFPSKSTWQSAQSLVI